MQDGRGHGAHDTVRLEGNPPPVSDPRPPTDWFDTFDTRSLHAALPADLTVQRVLVVHSPERDDIGRAHVLDGKAVTIGRVGSRGSKATFTVKDSSVSRLHAIVEPAGDGHKVRDLGSRNGTFVNGLRSVESGVDHGAVVRVGETVLLFQVLKVRRDEPLVGERPPLLGSSLAMERVRGQIDTLGPEAIPVLIQGESGVGKEVVASELHARSGRTGTFVPVNCGGLPAELVENELFGHVEGAFTGASKRAKGLFVSADGGTIFLDEIGEMPLEMQPKLLRVLSTGEVRPVGSSQPRSVQVRVVAATNRTLQDRVDRDAFRGDLYARLSGWRIDVPSLRERREDVLAIARRMPGAGRELAMTADAAEALLLYEWPYNVRELLQVVSAAIVRAGKGVELGLVHLPDEVRGRVGARVRRVPDPGSVTAPIEFAVRREGTPSRHDLEMVLAKYAGNVSQVAGFFGKERAQVYRWIRRYGIDTAAFRED